LQSVKTQVIDRDLINNYVRIIFKNQTKNKVYDSI